MTFLFNPSLEGQLDQTRFIQQKRRSGCGYDLHYLMGDDEFESQVINAVMRAIAAEFADNFDGKATIVIRTLTRRAL